MASWIVHLRIAENLLQAMSDLDTPMFAIGNIAPDSGIPDENWENFTPPVEVTHFRLDNRGYNEDLRFFKKYFSAESLTENAREFPFRLGYFFHLVTDNYWWKRIGQPTRERFMAEYEADEKFIWEVKRDWYGLDFICVRDHPDSLFWQSFLQSDIQQSYLDFLPLEALHHRMSYIKEFYQRQDEKVLEMYQRPYIYLSKTEMDRFVDRVSEELLGIYQYVSDPKQDISGYSSALELPQFAA